MRRIASLLITVIALAGFASDTVNFLDLVATPKDGRLVLTPQARSLLDYSIFKTDAYNLQKLAVEQTLDAPIRLTGYLLRTLDRNRGTLVTGNAPLPILTYEFELALREPTGVVIASNQYQVTVGLDGEAGMGLITYANGSTWRFSLAGLTESAAYHEYMQHLAFPGGETSFVEPSRSDCLIDLYYKWPKLVQDSKKVNVFDLFPAWLTWEKKGPLTKVGVHLGSTYLRRVGGVWQQSHSSSLYAMKDAVELYGRVLETNAKGNARKTIPLLEEYVSRVPGDRKALKLLMDNYLEDQRNDEAYDLISRFKPLFATIRGGLPNMKALEDKAERRRNLLLGRRASFRRDETVKLQILNPTSDDLVTGRTDLKFSLEGHSAKLVSVGCFLDDELITELAGPPYEAAFSVENAKGTAKLRVIAYFDNETYQADEISFRTIKIDQQESVQLVTVRATVLQDGGQRQLKAEDFTLLENGKSQALNNFHKDNAPLRVAVLLDTSISMAGEKLYRAQYAVKTFLSKLSAEDRSSLFTFDLNVARLDDWTNDHPKLSDKAMTLSLQYGTSLYDAILIAHDSLMSQNGTKVMIVVSDGDDSSSSTTDLHVLDVLRDSPVLVYSVILTGGPMSDGRTGAELLRNLADITGSSSIRVKNLEKLDATFDSLYQDFKSLYYMDYYTGLPNRDDRKLELKVKGISGKIRARQLN